VEHILGDKFWIEMGAENFGLLRKGQAFQPLLVSRVADRLIVGWENLGVILWASDWGLDLDQVIGILTRININDVRVQGERIERLWGPLIK
jgi:hypothetical protein